MPQLWGWPVGWPWPPRSSAPASSRAFSACLKAKAERAALVAKMQVLEMKHALDMQRAQLEARKERLATEAELAAAEAKMNVFMESKSLAPGKSPQPSISKQLKSPQPSTSKHLKLENITPIHQSDMS